MNQYLLNIGRQRNDCDRLLSSAQVIGALVDRGFSVLRIEEAQSTTEPTFIVLVQERLNVLPYVQARFTGLASALNQDCIAAVLQVARHSTEAGDFPGLGIAHGELFGPNRDAWAPYNPEFFLTFA
ncbi:hypothetical protein RSB1_gp06 [Ralstonia phage RSB1]|uniref:Uncharacterized protein n=1 Tax=Ralstonia phage RSB1 TaxID=551790 RepID=B5BTU2_9CAUD|nr:hypothetical protein RSB1_gp06 [Ralstonia phage RSB1]BAG70364.1 hypothetical protein [Ralstonia phage RSB1]